MTGMFERVLATVDAFNRRWRLFLLPIVAMLPIAALITLLVPEKYVAKSTILLQSANRSGDWSGGSAGFPRQSTIEQVGVIEAWLKSDHVLGDLLPQLLDEVPTDAKARLAQIAILRGSLTFELTSPSVLDVKLEGPTAQGLGRRLEIIVSRLMEGILHPEAGILSSPQLVLLRRKEAIEEADTALRRAMAAAGANDVKAAETMRNQLKGIAELKRALARDENGAASSRSMLTQTLAGDRKAISRDSQVVERLETLYAASEEALSHLDSARQSMASKPDTYVRIFDSPEQLTVVGRPRDPLVGQGSARKLIVALFLFTLLLGAGFVFIAEVLDPRARTREDFETAAGLPLLARLPEIAQRKQAPRTQLGATLVRLARMDA